MIREARLPDDAVALTRVYMSSAEHHARLRPDICRVPESDSVVAHFRKASRRPAGGVLVVAETAGMIIGFVDVERDNPMPEYSMIADIPTVTLGIAVLAEYRGDGVGSMLMAAAEREAVRLGAGRRRRFVRS